MNYTEKSDLGNKDIFSRNLLRFIKMSQTTQSEVAKHVGVSQGTISDWTSGRSYPRMDKIQALANYFGVQKSDLVEDVYIDKEKITEEDQEVLDLFHKVKKEKRELVLSMIRAAIDNL